MNAGAKVIPLHGSAAARSAVARRAKASAERRGPDAQGDVVELTTPTVPKPRPGASLEQRLARAIEFLRSRVEGDYEVDEFGFDAQLTDQVMIPLFLPLYRRWFRVEVQGIDNVPDTGPALLVANHAGGIWPLDALMTAMAVHMEQPGHRFLRMLGADFVFRLPTLGSLARKTGTTVACRADTARLFAAGELVGIWPEGFRGIGKPFGERYKLQRFGRGGSVEAAIEAGVPIVPVSIVGSEEIHPVLANLRPVARLLNLPYLPVTPTFPLLGPLGLVPLPTKWYIQFGTPIETSNFGADAADDPGTVFDLTDRVRESIQTTLYRMLVRRRSIWR